jgi:hypothetical protein
MKEMRYYTTTPLRGSITFQCVFCDYRVNTEDFDSRKGNRRTQAAGAINQHATDLHLPSTQTPSRTAGVR